MRALAALVLVLLAVSPAGAQLVTQPFPEYDATKAYVAGQAVRFENSLWVCSTGGCPVGQSPAFNINPNPWNSTSGLRPWVSTTTYTPQAAVIRNGAWYTAIQQTTNEDPVSFPGVWSKHRPLPLSPTINGNLTLTGTSSSLSLSALKTPAAVIFSNQTVDVCLVPGSRPALQLGPTAATDPQVEFLNGQPATYADCGGIGPPSSGFEIHGNRSGGLGTSAPVSIFLTGYFNGGSGTQVELANKVNFAGDGKPQFWIEMPAGTPNLKMTNINSDGRFRMTSNGQPNSGIVFATLNAGVATDQFTINDNTSGTAFMAMPTFAGGGNRPVCVNNTGQLYAGSNSATPCP